MSSAKQSLVDNRNKDWLFCPYTGAMLELDAVRNVAYSQLSGYSISLDGT